MPQDGATPGSGGDGAGMPGKGGAGADGIVVVRLEKAFTPEKVPYPSFSTGVPWDNDKTVCPFSDLVAATNRFFIADIEGTLETNKVGRYNFTITLKDGYAWDDGSPTGDTTPRKFFWRVKEPDLEGHATAELTKTVEWSDGTNATLSISAHTTPEISADPPKVLVLGTLCDAHRLTAETVETCLNTAAEVADVDYYLYANVTEGGRAIFEFEEGMEEVAERYWNEFWTEFWASRDRWEEDGYELWTEYLEQFENNEDEGCWGAYCSREDGYDAWEDYLESYLGSFEDEDEAFEELCSSVGYWVAYYGEDYLSDYADYIGDEDEWKE